MRFLESIFTGVILASILYSTAADDDEYSAEDVPSLNCSSKYRSIDGSCNNLFHPTYGLSNDKYLRIFKPRYGDGISSFRLANDGKDLPGARFLSSNIFPDLTVLDDEYTLAFMQYGQIVAHDMSSNAGQRLRCCSADNKMLDKALLPKGCAPIPVPLDDPDFSPFHKECLSFTRTTTDIDLGDNPGNRPAEQITEVTPFLDLDITYGNTQELSDFLREHKGGLLKTEFRLNQSFPLRASSPSTQCALLQPQDPCYFLSDKRINQNPELALLQIIYIREHNRICRDLSKINPHWDDERLFQEARKILIGEHQYISYYEWLPPLLGEDEVSLHENLVLYNTTGYVNDYNKYLKPGVFQEHAIAAFRYLHTLIAGTLELLGELREVNQTVRLSDQILRPGILEQSVRSFDLLARGLFTQPELSADRYHTKEVTVFFSKGSSPVGTDLKSLDIQRPRDHGLPSYNSARVYAGLPRAEYFDDFLDQIAPDDVALLKKFYNHPDDVDLAVGGALEIIYKDTLAGVTFQYLMMKQFHRTRITDRFWFERPGYFTLEQLTEIRKASISRLICDNTLDVQLMQKKGFHVPSLDNPILPCTLLPVVNLDPWKEY